MLTDFQTKKIQGVVKRESSGQWPLIFEALGDRTRFCIFKILLRKQDICVTEIAKICKLTIPAVSHHLKILEMTGLVRKERHGKTVCYKIKNDEPKIAFISKLINF